MFSENGKHSTLRLEKRSLNFGLYILETGFEIAYRNVTASLLEEGQRTQAGRRAGPEKPVPPEPIDPHYHPAHVAEKEVAPTT